MVINMNSQRLPRRSLPGLTDRIWAGQRPDRTELQTIKLYLAEKIPTKFFPGGFKKNESGFSLIELIVGLSLLSLVFSLGCYGFNQLIPRYRLEGAVQCLVSDFQLARMMAIGQNCFYRIQIVPEQGHYLLERESSAGVSRWPGVQEGIIRKFDSPANPYYFPGVELESNSNNPVFSPRGTVTGTTVVLKNSSGQRIITLSSQGRVKVQGV